MSGCESIQGREKKKNIKKLLSDNLLIFFYVVCDCEKKMLADHLILFVRPFIASSENWHHITSSVLELPLIAPLIEFGGKYFPTRMKICFLSTLRIILKIYFKKYILKYLFF